MLHFNSADKDVGSGLPGSGLSANLHERCLAFLATNGVDEDRKSFVQDSISMLQACSAQEIIECAAQILTKSYPHDTHSEIPKYFAMALVVVLEEQSVEGSGTSTKPSFRFSSDARHKVFRILAEHAVHSFVDCESWSERLGITLTYQDAKLCLEGFIKGAASLSCIWQLCDKYGVKTDHEYADRFVRTNLLMADRWRYIPHIINMINAYSLTYTESEQTIFIENRVELNHFHDAYKLASHFNRDTSWISERELASKVATFVEVFVAGNPSQVEGKLRYTFDDGRRSYEAIREGIAACDPAWREKLISLATRMNIDFKIVRIWRDITAELFEARLAVARSEHAATDYRRNNAFAIIKLLEEDKALAARLSPEDQKRLVDLVSQPYPREKPEFVEASLRGPLRLARCCDFSLSAKDWEEILARFQNVAPLTVAHFPKKHLESEGIFVSREFKRTLFGIFTERAKAGQQVADSPTMIVSPECLDLVSVARLLEQPVDDELVALNLRSLRTAWRAAEAMERDGVPDLIDKDERRVMYARLVAQIEFPLGWSNIDRCAQLLGQEFSVEPLVQVVKGYLYDTPTGEMRRDAWLEMLEKIFDKYGVLGTETLEAYLAAELASKAIDFAKKIDGIDRVIDAFVEQRNGNWNWHGGAWRTIIDQAIIDGSVQVDKLGRFFDGLVDVEDVDWLCKVAQVATYKPTVNTAFRDAMNLERATRLYLFQRKLAESGRFEDAAQIQKSFKLPECEALTKWRALQN